MNENVRGTFFVDGSLYDVSFPVINQESERGYSFENNEDLKTNYGVREDESGNGINCIVLHWDVCESAKECFRRLCQRGVSAHIMIDGDGSVYQILDLIKSAYHASGCNQNSIGIMLQNPVNELKKDDKDRKPFLSREPGSNRIYSHLDFTEEQKEMVVRVCDELCQIFPNIPRILPPLSSDGLITTATLPKDEKIGIIAHYNAQPGRLGPGDSLWVEFYKAKYLVRD